MFIFGRSLGGAVAIHVAQERHDEVAGLIVENTLASVAHVIDDHSPLCRGKGHWLKRVFVRSKWQSINVVPNLSLPALFICGGRDRVI